MIGFAAAHPQFRQCPAAAALADRDPRESRAGRPRWWRPLPRQSSRSMTVTLATDGMQRLGDARSGDDDGFDVLRGGQGRAPECDEHKRQQGLSGHVRLQSRVEADTGKRHGRMTARHPDRPPPTVTIQDGGRSPGLRGFPGHFLPRPKPSGLRVPLAYRCGGSAGFAFAHRLPCFICRADTPSRRVGSV